MSPSSMPRFGVVVPVKPPAHAKSRLAPLGDRTRRALVTAFAADTVTAALASPLVSRVLVVTDDHELASYMSALGAHVVPDGVADDLNASLVQAAAEVTRRWPDLSLAALCADLPALDTHELTSALDRAASAPAAFVADSDGMGTTLLTAAGIDDFVPCFGPDSREAHLASGAHEIDDLDVRTLRRDVDTPQDLEAALTLGVGPRTALAAEHALG